MCAPKRKQRRGKRTSDQAPKEAEAASEHQAITSSHDSKFVSLEIMGYPDKKLEYPVILARKDKAAWAASLQKYGIEGLLLKNFSILENPPSEEYYAPLLCTYWMVKNEFPPTTFFPFESPVPTDAPPGIYTHRPDFPLDTAVTAIMGVVGSLLQATDPSPMSNTVPHLLVSSSFGFTSQYLKDNASLKYRCFLFMGKESMRVTHEETIMAEHEGSRAEHGQSFVAVGDSETMKTFGEYQVLTMTALYKEAHRKFRLQVGDILIVKGHFPFAVDLALNDGMEKSRMLSWGYRDKIESPGLVPIPRPEPIHTIEDILSKNEEALQFYSTEMSEIELQPKDEKDKGDVTGYMERFRVTPRIYRGEEIMARIQTETGYHDIYDWIERK